MSQPPPDSHQPLRTLVYANQPDKARQVLAWLLALSRNRSVEVIIQKLERASASELEAVRVFEGGLAAAGKESSIRVSGRTGSPEEVIAAECRESEYGLIVLAPAGRHGLVRLMHGSMVAHVVQRVSASTLIVRGERAAPPAKVLACVSGARHSLTTVGVAAQAAGLFEAQLTLLMVLSQVSVGLKESGGWDRDPASFLDSDDPLSRQIKIGADLASRIGPRPVIRIRQGMVGEEILREINAGKYDLLVVGSHWAQDFDTVYEDLTSDLVQLSPISTLVVGARAALL